MADKEHLDKLKEAFAKGDIEVWNKWKDRSSDIEQALNEASLIEADLSGAKLWGSDLCGANLSSTNLRAADLRAADLSEAYLFAAYLRKAALSGAVLKGADLSQADLSGASLSGADLRKADLTGANLAGARLSGADIRGANLTGANLTGARLHEAHCWGTNFRGADLKNADLTRTNLYECDLTRASLEGCILVQTNLDGADLSYARVHGISARDTKGSPKNQKNLVITPEGLSQVTVDDLEVARFVGMLITHKKIRKVINNMSAEAVMILGSYSEKKFILNGIADELRRRDLMPIIFDFDKPLEKDTIEIIKTLAGICKFVIADITQPKWAGRETSYILPVFGFPFVPLVEENEKPLSTFEDFRNHPWVLEERTFNRHANTRILMDEIIGSTGAKYKEIQDERAVYSEG